MQRPFFYNAIEQAFKVTPIVALLGPRQCGKTTLANMYAKAHSDVSVTHFDLENPIDLAKLDEPMLALKALRGLIIIDEIQRKPNLFPLLRVLADEKVDRKFLILGSASRDLIQQSSESLAGRISYIEMTPFSYPEVKDMNKLLLRGGFPRSYLAENDEHSYAWRNQYITTYLEQDIPNLGIRIPAPVLRRFWMMLTHYHGNVFNASELGKSLGIAHTTARHYLDILTSTFMIRELSPWWENISKRQIKSPKIYFRDSGILNNLLSISTWDELYHHPKSGSLWEGFAIEEILRFHSIRPEEAFFWGVHGQGELDLLIFRGGKRIGFEIKYADAPRMTKSMHFACAELDLHELIVIYPGEASYPLDSRVRVVGLKEYCNARTTI